MTATTSAQGSVYRLGATGRGYSGRAGDTNHIVISSAKQGRRNALCGKSVLVIDVVLAVDSAPDPNRISGACPTCIAAL